MRKCPWPARMRIAKPIAPGGEGDFEVSRRSGLQPHDRVGVARVCQSRRIVEVFS